MAPEQVTPGQVDLEMGKVRKESDVYSLAVTAYEVCYFNIRAMVAVGLYHLSVIRFSLGLSRTPE